jgi:hypothetical protein
LTLTRFRSSAIRRRTKSSVGRRDSTALELSSEDPASSTDRLIHRLAGRDCDSVFQRESGAGRPT